MPCLHERAFDEGEYADNISQYPLKDLDKFYGHISDFYDERNVSGSKIGYLEFAAMEISDFPKHTASSRPAYFP